MLALPIYGREMNRDGNCVIRLMTPINTRTSPSEVNEMVGHTYLEVICRFHRGTDFDRVEQIFHARLNSRAEDVNWLFGVSENRHLFRGS